MDWKPIATLDSDETVIFGKWYEDDCGGYYGESRWLWIASGCIGENCLWIDFTDDTHPNEYHAKATHWASMEIGLSQAQPTPSKQQKM